MYHPEYEHNLDFIKIKFWSECRTCRAENFVQSPQSTSVYESHWLEKIETKFDQQFLKKMEHQPLSYPNLPQVANLMTVQVRKEQLSQPTTNH